MVLSPYFDDKSIISTLRSFFDVEEQWKIDFKAAVALVEDYDDEKYVLRIKGRTFLIHKVHGGVEEVEK